MNSRSLWNVSVNSLSFASGTSLSPQIQLAKVELIIQISDEHINRQDVSTRGTSYCLLLGISVINIRRCPSWRISIPHVTAFGDAYTRSRWMRPPQERYIHKDVRKKTCYIFGRPMKNP